MRCLRMVSQTLVSKLANDPNRNEKGAYEAAQSLGIYLGRLEVVILVIAVAPAILQ